MSSPALAEGGQTVDAQLLDLMLKVGSRWVLWLLLILSVVAVAIALERAWFFFRARQRGQLLQKALETMQIRGAPEALIQLGDGNSMQDAVLRVALRHANQGAESVAEHVAGVLENERLRYERGLAFLGTLGSNAPFVGLFGTVLGIIRDFHDLAANTAQGAQAVMAGIAEALVATAVGLLVALPAVALYNSFSRHVEASLSSSTALHHSILAFIKAKPAAAVAETKVT